MPITIASSTFANAAISEKEEILHDIHSETKNIAVWQRPLVGDNSFMQELTEQDINRRAIGSPEEIKQSFQEYFKDLPEGKEPLLKDILRLVNLFSKVTESSTFRVLLASVQTNMCRKFHTDINDLRMLCTYVGQGTLWVPDEAIEGKVGGPGLGASELLLNENLIQQAEAGDVLILKGAMYRRGKAILHRSPSIEENGEKRLLLRIDTNETMNLWK